MYRKILVAVENSTADQTILTHVAGLAQLTGAELLLVHVADGWAARHFDQLNLRESEEMKTDRAYLERLRERLTGEGFKVRTELAMGDPATEPIRLGIVSALAATGRLSFTELKRLLRTTDGNLSVHARKLEEADYVACEKAFAGRVPRTEYRLTAVGRRALEKYLAHMESIIKAAKS